MRILMLGSDSNVLVEGTEAHERMRRYASVFEELHVVVMTSQVQPEVRRGNLFLNPAYSNSGIGQRWRLYAVARAVCRAARPNIVSVQSPDEIGLIGLLLTKKFKMPLQLQIHTDVFSPHYRRAGVKEWIRAKIARWLLPYANCVRVVSERIKRSIVHIPYRITHIPIAVLPIHTDIAKFRDATRDPNTDERFKDFHFKMIAVGRFVDKEKNFSMLIDAMREFMKLCPKALLVLVGDGPDRRKYELRIKNQALEKNIHLESWRDDLPSFYKSFDLSVMPSNYEGWGRTVIEAMAAGLPVVMTDVGLAGEVVCHNENGIVVPVADRDGLALALAELFRNPARLRLLRENAKKTAEAIHEVSPNVYLQKYRDAFQCCMPATKVSRSS